MLPLRSDCVDVLLTPQGVGLRRRHTHRLPERPTFALWSDVDAAGGLHWAAPLETLEHLLDTPGLRGAHALICLSNHFTRCALMPASDLLITHDDVLRFARHNFERVHGAPASTWSVRVTTLPDGSHLASGVDRELVDALRALLQTHGLVPRGLEPALMTLYNAARAALPAEACRLVVVEPGLAITALLQPQWRHVRTHRLRRPGGAELAHLIERERSFDDEGAAQAPTCLLPLVPLEPAPLPSGTRAFDAFWTPSRGSAVAAVAAESQAIA